MFIKSSICIIIGLAALLSLSYRVPAREEYKLIMTAPICVWKDTADMNLQLKLVNNSRQPVQVFDELLDDMYNDEPLVSNIQFLIEKKTGDSFEVYRAILCQLRIPDLNKKILTTEDLLDSVQTIRNAMINIPPGDTLQSNYSLSIGRVSFTGKYRVKALFDVNMCDRYNKHIESNWVFFEMGKDIELVRPSIAYESGRQFFWTKTSN